MLYLNNACSEKSNIKIILKEGNVEKKGKELFKTYGIG